MAKDKRANGKELVVRAAVGYSAGQGLEKVFGCVVFGNVPDGFEAVFFGIHDEFRCTKYLKRIFQLEAPAGVAVFRPRQEFAVFI